MKFTIYTTAEDLPLDIYEFGQSPISNFGYVSEDFFWDESDYHRSRDTYISPTIIPRYNIPINSMNEAMYFAWDDWDYCVVPEKDFSEDDLLGVWRILDDTSRYDMPDGRAFFVRYH